MLGVALFFIGAVLIVNGVGLTGRIEGRDSAPFNLLVGLLALFTNGLGLAQGVDTADFFCSRWRIAVCFYLSLPGSSAVARAQRRGPGLVLLVCGDQHSAIRCIRWRLAHVCHVAALGQSVVLLLRIHGAGQGAALFTGVYRGDWCGDLLVARDVDAVGQVVDRPAVQIPGLDDWRLYKDVRCLMCR